MSGNKKKLIAFNYFGGKFQMVQKLYDYFPKHDHFVDLFCGSMVVTLNKPLSNIDTANDINEEVVNFFKTLREQPQELLSLLYLTPTSRQEYDQAWDVEGYSNVEKARRFYVRLRQSFYGLGSQRKNKGWGPTCKNSRANVAEIVSKWLNGVEKLLPVIDRLKCIQIENRDFRELVPLTDDSKTFYYCDPPYHRESRTSHHDYMYDFSNVDHQDLAEVLHRIKGMFMISGYECPKMNKLYKNCVMVPLGDYHTISGRKGRECIWMNYEGKNRGQATIPFKEK